MKDILTIGGKEFTSRLFVGTGKFSSNRLMLESILASGSQMITVAMKRIDMKHDETEFNKLEIHPDPKYLLPDPIETLKATEILAKEGFKVLPYIQADPVLCKRLEEVGTAAVMPLGAPIGTNKGLKTRDLLEIIIAVSRVPVVIDAGLGAPSHAADAMEMGADAVLVNTAIAVAGDPVEMAVAFKLAVEAGRKGYLAGLGSVSSSVSATSPLTAFLD